MAEQVRLQVKFWGVRGSTPTPVAENLGFGGNTTCLEICSGSGDRIVIDAGTGARALGNKLVRHNQAEQLDLFFTHFHWDHIQGIPFFAPLTQPGLRINFHSFPDAEEICARLRQQMSSPFFTLDFNEVKSRCDFFRNDAAFRKGDLSVVHFPLFHPQGACGYRIEVDGASIVVATDFEHGNPQFDRILRANADGADLLIYDAQYTPAEYESRRGWGHSTPFEAARAAKDAKVKRLILFHHDPSHDDATIRHIVQTTIMDFENVAAAQEGETIIL